MRPFWSRRGRAGPIQWSGNFNQEGVMPIASVPVDKRLLGVLWNDFALCLCIFLPLTLAALVIYKFTPGVGWTARLGNGGVLGGLTLELLAMLAIVASDLGRPSATASPVPFLDGIAMAAIVLGASLMSAGLVLRAWRPTRAPAWALILAAWRPRVKLRTLLLLVAALTIPLGWFAWELDQARRDDAAVAWIERHGGSVTEETWGATGEQVRQVHFNHAELTDLTPLLALRRLDILRLEKSQVGDCSALAKMTELRSLTFESTPSPELALLLPLTRLETLALSHPPLPELARLTALPKLRALVITDLEESNLAPLAELKQLEVLALVASTVSDFTPLAEMANLEKLYLVDMQRTELSSLAELKQLKQLILRKTGDDQQVQALRWSLPTCWVSDHDEPGC